MSAAVLDASALLALVNRESGAEAVARHGSTRVISAVNLAEVASRMSDLGVDDAAVGAVLDQIEFRVVPFDSALAYAAARLRRATRFIGLSLGDRACLALAQSLGAPVLTADRAWARLKLPIEIRLIR